MLGYLLGISLAVIEISIFGYFFYTSIYNFALSIAGLSFRSPEFSSNGLDKHITLLVPAYKEDDVIIGTVKEILKTKYPKDHLNIIVIADSLNEQSLIDLRKMPIQVHQVSFENSTKVKAINSALKECKESDILVVLDADNIPEKMFFQKVNDLYSKGIKCLQGKREIKNELNYLTYLDDLSEQINNHINRKGSNSLGGSASIAGSGFYVDFEIGRSIFKNLDSVGGFDKEFEALLLMSGIHTYFNDRLVVYDEKVASAGSFQNQRRRWISSQYVFLSKYWRSALLELVKGKFALFNSVILRNIQLPRFMNLGIFSVITLAALFFLPINDIKTVAYVLLYLLFVASILLAIPKRLYSLKMIKALVLLPNLFVRMISILFRLKGADKKFIHTPHYTKSINRNE